MSSRHFLFVSCQCYNEEPRSKLRGIILSGYFITYKTEEASGNLPNKIKQSRIIVLLNMNDFVVDQSFLIDRQLILDMTLFCHKLSINIPSDASINLATCYWSPYYRSIKELTEWLIVTKNRRWLHIICKIFSSYIKIEGIISLSDLTM
jgi:hypothetical protein